MADIAFIFAGPSLFGADLDDRSNDGISWLPPARRGDIERLTAQHASPGTIGLADGTFHAYPSVGHVELREAIQAGWLVYGLCSMGAIRASEMKHMGMRPWGRVAEAFCTDKDFADDEVALVHGADAPFAPLSEPLIHIREFCADARRHGLLSVEQETLVIGRLRERWYGERTLANLRQELCSALGAEHLPDVLERSMDDFKPFRLKQADLRTFVALRPWINSASHSHVG